MCWLILILSGWAICAIILWCCLARTVDPEDDE